MASANIPGVFTPHVLHYKDEAGNRYARPDKGLYVDGGLLYNFPLPAFDHPKYQRSEQWGEVSNPRTLGLKLRAIEEPIPLEEIKDVKDLIQGLLLTFWHAQELLQNTHTCNEARIINLNIHAVPLTKFNLTKEEQTRLIQEGQDSVGFFFKT